MQKRILVISRLMTSGGAERVAANLASQLNVGNDKTWLVVFDGTNATYSTDAPVIDLQSPMQKSPLRKLFWYIKTMIKVGKLKKKLRITHAISFLNEPDLINILTSFRGKAIVSVRNNRSSLNKGIITKCKDRLVFNAADRVVSLSEGVKDDLIDFYGTCSDKIDVIYNTCDVADIRSQASISPVVVDDSIFSDGKTVITAGRLMEQKGHWHLIRAFKEVVKAIPDARLLILGQGEKEAYLTELIDGLNLESSVKLMGYQKNPYYYLAKSDVFVFSSLFEGFGNILLEAMACGLPIISTDCMVGPRELLAPGTSYQSRVKDCVLEAENGLLVPVCDGKHYKSIDPITTEEMLLSQAIILMLKNDGLRNKYGQRSAVRIQDFTDERIIMQWSTTLDNSLK